MKSAYWASPEAITVPSVQEEPQERVQVPRSMAMAVDKKEVARRAALEKCILKGLAIDVYRCVVDGVIFLNGELWCLSLIVKLLIFLGHKMHMAFQVVGIHQSYTPPADSNGMWEQAP